MQESAETVPRKSTDLGCSWSREILPVSYLSHVVVVIAVAAVVVVVVVVAAAAAAAATVTVAVAVAIAIAIAVANAIAIAVAVAAVVIVVNLCVNRQNIMEKYMYTSGDATEKAVKLCIIFVSRGWCVLLLSLKLRPRVDAHLVLSRCNFSKNQTATHCSYQYLGPLRPDSRWRRLNRPL